MMTAAPFIVSADSHVTEPADLWLHRLDRKYRDQAPRVVRDYGNDRYLFVAPRISPFAIATGFGAGKQGHELKQHLRRGYEAARAGGWDPVERVKDQDADGVACEILYPTHGMKLFALPDADLQRACFRVYNDWIVEFSQSCRARLVPLAAISLYDITASVREVERAARQGARGVLVWGAPPENLPPFGSPIYDPFWAVVSSLALPVSLHCITSGQPQIKSKSPYVQYLDVIHDVQRSLAEIVCGGVLERFPGLTIVSAENDCGWFPHFLFRLDHAHEKFGRFAACRCNCAPVSTSSIRSMPRFKRTPRCRWCAIATPRTGICGRRTTRTLIRPGPIRAESLPRPSADSPVLWPRNWLAKMLRGCTRAEW